MPTEQTISLLKMNTETAFVYWQSVKKRTTTCIWGTSARPSTKKENIFKHDTNLIYVGERITQANRTKESSKKIICFKNNHFRLIALVCLTKTDHSSIAINLNRKLSNCWLFVVDHKRNHYLLNIGIWSSVWPCRWNWWKY